MKNYTKPNIEISKFAVEDIITASGVIVNAQDFTGKDKEMYDVYMSNSKQQSENVSVFTW